MDAGCFCVADAAALGDLSLILRGSCSRSTSREVRGSPAISYYGRRLLLRGRCSTWRTSVSCCVAGAALGASQSHFAWQVQHPSISVSRCVAGAAPGALPDVCGRPATIEYYGRRLLLRGRCSTWRSSLSFCVAGAAFGAPPERSAEVRRRR